MKTVGKIFLFFLIIAFISLGILWVFRAKVLAHYIGQSLNNAPVSIEKVNYKQKTLYIDRLKIGNIQDRKKTAFSSEEISISLDWKKLTGKKTVIEKIALSNIDFQLQFYQNETSNWSKILEQKKADNKKKIRPYVIQELELNNLSFLVTMPNGKKIRYPTIKKMVLHNISSETGFPLHKVEKVLFELVLKNLLRNFGIRTIENIFKNIIPDPSGFPLLEN